MRLYVQSMAKGGPARDDLLEITILHNAMILFTLTIISRRFALGFPKSPHTNGDLFLKEPPKAIRS